MSFENTAIPVQIEVAPLIKTVAAQQIDQFARWAQSQPDTINIDQDFDIMSVRRDQAVGAHSGNMQSRDMAEIAFHPSHFQFDDGLSSYHETQAERMLGKLSSVSGGYRLESVKLMMSKPTSLETDTLSWQIVPNEERVLPDHKLPTDNDLSGELEVWMRERAVRNFRAGHFMARILMFNGLGGNETMFPPAVAGIYDVVPVSEVGK